MKSALNLVLALSLAGAVGCADDKKNDVRPNEKAVEADNTGRNERDRNDMAKTPTDQQENDRDLGITQEVRKAVVDDDALSFNAKNAKIVTADGVVTLRGPVASEVEKAAVEAKAKSVAGVTRVDNQLEIAP
jgi:hyperosmotically inducible protein